jgi:toxin ParE1/3/4
VARVELAPEVGDDLDRILDHLVRFEIADAPSRIGEILMAFDVLEQNPLIGRIVQTQLRELVIGRQARGYVALYKYVAELDIAFVLAIRGQKEAGYTEARDKTRK